jgi:hypothetical protein
MVSNVSNDRCPSLLLENRAHGWLVNLRGERVLSRVRACILQALSNLHVQPGLNQEDRDAVQQMDFDADYGTEDVDAISYTAPPGEEGFDISHEGGEFAVFEDVAAGLAESSG